LFHRCCVQPWAAHFLLRKLGRRDHRSTKRAATLAADSANRQFEPELYGHRTVRGPDWPLLCAHRSWLHEGQPAELCFGLLHSLKASPCKAQTILTAAGTRELRP